MPFASPPRAEPCSCSGARSSGPAPVHASARAAGDSPGAAAVACASPSGAPRGPSSAVVTPACSSNNPSSNACASRARRARSRRVTSARWAALKHDRSRASTSALGAAGQRASSAASSPRSTSPPRYARSASARARENPSSSKPASSPTRARSWLPSTMRTWSGGCAASHARTARPSRVACSRCAAVPQSKWSPIDSSATSGASRPSSPSNPCRSRISRKTSSGACGSPIAAWTTRSRPSGGTSTRSSASANARSRAAAKRAAGRSTAMAFAAHLQRGSPIWTLSIWSGVSGSGSQPWPSSHTRSHFASAGA